MKLSEKGANKILVNNVIRTPDGESYLILNDLIKTKFEPDDFKDCVLLTIEEAKQVQKEFLDIVCEIVRVLGHYGVKYAKPASLIMLEERIEQAEERKNDNAT